MFCSNSKDEDQLLVDCINQGWKPVPQQEMFGITKEVFDVKKLRPTPSAKFRKYKINGNHIRSAPYFLINAINKEVWQYYFSSFNTCLKKKKNEFVGKGVT